MSWSPKQGVTRNVAKQLNADDNKEVRLGQALDEFFEAIDAGQEPDRARLLEEYADIADELADCLRNIDFIHHVAPQLAENHSEHGEGTGARVNLGDFRIVREIGRGGMGVVYEAEQMSLGRRMALKVLPFASMLDKQQLKRFKNEARAAATLVHPHIVTVHSVGEERGVHYYAMQLVEGQSLAEVISELRAANGIALSVANSNRVTLSTTERGPNAGAYEPSPDADVDMQLVSPDAETRERAQVAISTVPTFDTNEYFRTVARLGVQAANALDHAHQNGVLHRDIKPGNLMVDRHLSLFITDFGLARVESAIGMTMTGDVIGTLGYMSPEQALAKRVVIDHRTDIYSLGVTLYELLTLSPPYTGYDRQELLRQIAFDEPRRPRQINRRIPRDLETIVVKAIEKSPGDRYETAQGLADDLQRFLNQQPIQSQPPTLLKRARKWAQRHQSFLTISVVMMALLLVATTTASVIVWREKSRTQIALSALQQQRNLAYEKAEQAARSTVASRAVVDYLIQLLEHEGKLRGEEDYTLRMLNNLGVHLSNNNAAADAYEIYREIYPIVRRLKGDEHEVTAIAFYNFAKALFLKGDLAKQEKQNDEAIADFETALPMLRHALQTLSKHFGPHDSCTLSCAGELGEVLSYLGYRHNDLVMQNEAKKITGDRLEALQRLLGEQHPQTLEAMADHGRVLHRLSKGSGGDLHLEAGHLAYRTQAWNTLAYVGWSGIARVESPRDKATLLFWRAIGNSHIDGPFQYSESPIQEADEILRDYPGDVELIRLRDEAISTLAARKRILEAKSTLDVASAKIELNPLDPNVWLERARLRAQEEAWDAAAVDWIEAIKLSEDSSSTRSALKLVCRELAKWPEIFARVSERMPDESTIWAGRAQHHALRSQWANAANDYERAFRSKPRNDETVLDYAGTLLILGDEAGYQRLCSELADDLDTGNRARTLAIGLADASRAEELATWAEERLTDAPWNLHILGLLQYRARRFEDAIKNLERSNLGWAEESKSQNWLVLAMCQHELGKDAAAHNALERARALLDKFGPEQPGEPFEGWVSDWVELELLQQEVAAMFGQESASLSPSKQRVVP